MSSLEDLCQNADQHTQQVDAQIQAAYACDREGDEARALTYYERAWSLGIPAQKRRHFITGYSSTLRNNDLSDKACVILSEALREDPDYVPFELFLSLALLDIGKRDEAISTLFRLVMSRTPPLAMDGYDEAIGYYIDQWRGQLDR